MSAGASTGTTNGAAANEAALVASLRAGDERACEQFVREQTGRALAVVRRILANEEDACEAVQNAFLSFFRSLGEFQQQARLATWLHRIVINAALIKRRSRVRAREQSLDDLLPAFLPDGHRRDTRPAWQPDVAELAQRSELRRLVREKIDRLPEDYRNVLLLRDIEGLDTEQAAEVLGDSAGAVKTRLHRARQALRMLLEREWSP